MINLRKIFSLIFIGIFTYFLIDFIQQNSGLLENFKKLNFFLLIILLLLTLLNQFIKGYVNIYLFNSLNISMKLKESFEISYKNTLGNLIGPIKAGSGYKLHYMNKNYNVSPTQFVSLNTAYSVISIIVSIFILLITLLLANNTSPASIELLILLLFALSISTFLGVNLLLFFSKKVSITIISNFANGFKSVYLNKLNFIYILLIALFHQIYSIFIIFFIFEIFSFNIDLLSSAIYSTVGSLGNFANITPGNIGFYELVMISSNFLHGVSTEQVLISSVLARAISYCSVVFIYIYYLSKKLIQRTQ